MKSLQHTIKATMRPGEDSGYVAECLEVAVVTQGSTLDEVTRNLQEAGALYLEGEDLQDLGLTPRLWSLRWKSSHRMPNLKRLSGSEVVSILQNFGFVVVDQKGSHLKLRRTISTGKDKH